MVGSKPRRMRRSVTVRQGHFAVPKVGAVSFDIREPYYIAVASSWSVFIGLGLAILVVIVAFFALLFLVDPRSVQGGAPGDFAHAFFFSLQVISAAGFGAMSPDSLYGYIVAGVDGLSVSPSYPSSPVSCSCGSRAPSLGSSSPRPL
jgi:hypothetical protein